MLVINCFPCPPTTESVHIDMNFPPQHHDQGAKKEPEIITAEPIDSTEGIQEVRDGVQMPLLAQSSTEDVEEMEKQLGDKEEETTFSNQGMS